MPRSLRHSLSSHGRIEPVTATQCITLKFKDHVDDQTKTDERAKEIRNLYEWEREAPMTNIARVIDKPPATFLRICNIMVVSASGNLGRSS